MSNSHELERIRKCKGALFNIKKNMTDAVKTIILLDSNGRSIRDEDVGGEHAKSVIVRNVGGLCMPAASEAIRRANLVYPHIKSVVLGIGTNDKLHGVGKIHKEDPSVYVKELDGAVRKMFPGATISYILPFREIHGIDDAFLDSLKTAIKSSNVKWKILIPPSVKGKLAPPENIHLQPKFRWIFAKWLRKLFMPQASSTVTSSQPATQLPKPVERPPTISSPPVIPVRERIPRGYASYGDLSHISNENLLDVLVGRLHPPDLRSRNQQWPHMNIY